MKYLIVFLALVFPACATSQVGMGACRTLCQSGKVELYRGETEECRCSKMVLTNTSSTDNVIE